MVLWKVELDREGREVRFVEIDDDDLVVVVGGVGIDRGCAVWLCRGVDFIFAVKGLASCDEIVIVDAGKIVRSDGSRLYERGCVERVCPYSSGVSRA